MTTTEKSSVVGPLTRALWFPAFFVVGFMIFYMLPFHAASPNHLPVAVVGQQATTSLDTTLARAMPGGLDLSAVDDATAARAAVFERDVAAAYDPGSGTTYIAGAEGQQVSQIVQRVLAPIAAQSGHSLQVVDVAPTARGDLLGNSLFYIVMAWNIAGYIVVMMLMQAVELSTRTKLLTLVGFGFLATTVAWLFGISVHAIGVNPAVLLIGFLLTQAVSWTTFALAPLVRRALPGVAMGLFVLLSIPSSDGALSRWMMPTVFQWLHYVMPLGNAIDGSRAIMYFGGNGWLRPVLVLVAWVALGVGLLVYGRRRAPGVEHSPVDEAEQVEKPHREYLDDEASVGGGEYDAHDAHGQHAGLLGRVVHADGTSALRAVVTVTDATGRQVGRSGVDGSGRFRIHLPCGVFTVVVQEAGCRPTSDRVVLTDRTHREFRLVSEHDAGRVGAPVVAAAGASTP